MEKERIEKITNYFPKFLVYVNMFVVNELVKITASIC